VSRRALLWGAVFALSAAATCRGEGPGGSGTGGSEAVPAQVEPTEVEIDWPDAAVMPPPAPSEEPSSSPQAPADAGA
jgi:hypothetical protein